MIRGLLFDFDGLIVDTELAIFHSWQEMFQLLGGHLDMDEWVKVVGTMDDELDYFDDILAQTGRDIDVTHLRQTRLQRETELVAAQPILPGVMEYLESAHRLGLHIGLASSSPWEWVSGHLTRLGLIDYFEHITTRGQTARLKPHPDPYLALLSAFGLAPNEAIVLEDSAPGVAAGRSAGIFTVAVPNSLTRRLPLDHASLILNSLAELPLEQLIQRTNGAGKKSY